MHLAIVSPFPPTITGIGQYGYHLSRALGDLGLFEKISVLAGSSSSNNLNGTDHFAPLQVEYPWQLERLDTSLKIISRLRELKPDLVWFNMGASAFGRSPLANLSGFLTPVLAQKMGFPTVVTLHELIEAADLQALKVPGGIFAQFGAKLLTRSGTYANVVCLTTQDYVDKLKTRYPNVRGIHIPIGAYRTPDLLPEEQNPELLFFTTLAPFKGLEGLLKAFSSLLEEIPSLRLSIAGATHVRFADYAARLKQQYSDLAGIRWLGEVPEDKVQDIFRKAQIIVLPYTASSGSSSVLYQAVMWGRPIVASDLAEIRSFVVESNMKVVYSKVGNTESLVQAIRFLLESASARHEQVAHNFKSIQHFRPEQTCIRYLHAFNLALELRRSEKRIVIPAQLTLEQA